MKIGIIGCGNMGEAIIKGQRAKGKGQSLIASDKSEKRRNYIRKKYHISVVKDNVKLLKESEVIILAVKPQDIKDVLNEVTLYPLPITLHPLFISIAAGISTHFIEGLFKLKVKVIRVMPNMTALIGQGISVICKGKYATAKDLDIAKKIFNSLGEVIEVEEKYLNLITGLSGSGPAYFFYFVEQLIKTGICLGLKKDVAEKLVIQTGLGSLKMLVHHKVHGGDTEGLRKRVASKGGTTEAALKIFQKRKIDKTFDEAIRAAVKRAKELEQ